MRYNDEIATKILAESHRHVGRLIPHIYTLPHESQLDVKLTAEQLIKEEKIHAKVDTIFNGTCRIIFKK